MNNNGKRVAAPRLGIDVFLCKPAETDNSSHSPRGTSDIMQEKVAPEAVTTSSINFLLPFKGSRIAGEDTRVFLQEEGESFRTNCSYDMHKHSHEKKFWCKEQSEKYCSDLPLSFPLEERIGPNWALYRPVDLRDFGEGWFSVIMTALRKEDSGTYQCGVWVEMKQVLLQRIQMLISPKASAESSKTEHTKRKLSDPSDLAEKRRRGGENWNMDAIPTDDSRKDQRTLYAVMVLTSLLATAALISTVTLITSYIKKKRAGKERDTDRHPASRKGVLQEGIKKANRMPDGDHNESTIYAAIRHQPQPEHEEVMYVNIQPSPKVFFLREPSGSSLPSVPVEYATVIFEATTPQSETDERQTGLQKESGTKPSAY
ncbi:hypothetical protein ASZ78_001634 [Callipepla squamata]|uniref:Immunoglobulin V-set domain-containing protein n=1 Tax=Callipepla squamata TaxID=9009 RepID=A0A226MJK0_CALSU|nr:hypothetical protein ASZ78_001634 [Callipepla squamata]